MNLLEVRTQFVKSSGRYDLVTDAASDDYSDNGADYFINAGIQMLGRLVALPATKARLFYAVTAGDYSLTWQHNCRVINEVWINNDETRYQLQKVTLDEFKTIYPGIASDTTTDAPLHYAIAELRALETTDKDSLGTFIDVTDTNYDYRGIIFGPPADTDYVIEISGMFKNVELSDDADENYWTLQESDLVVRAAMYKLEAYSRGTENAKNWLSAIKEDVFELQKDVAQEESYGIDQMEG